MVWRFIFFVCVLSLSDASLKCDKDCNCSKDKPCGILRESNDLKNAEDENMIIVDDEKGIVRFVLPVLSNGTIYSYAWLYECDNTLSEGNCSTSTFHSGKDCTVNGTRGQKYYLEFEYVYSARYLLHHRSSSYSEDTFMDVNTKHIKTDFKNDSINTASDYNTENELLRLIYEMDPVFLNTTVRLELVRDDYTASLWWVVKLEGETLPILCSSNSPMKPAACSFKKWENGNYELNCPVEFVEPGNYTYAVKVLDDDRCHSKSTKRVWSGECSWNYRKSIQSIILPPRDIPHHERIPIKPLLILLPTVLLTLLSVCLFLLLRRYQKHCRDISVLHDPENRNEAKKCKILLVYAQDCQPFMDMMAEFRKTLETAYRFEVLDCFDKCRFNEISLNQDQWMIRHMASRDVKVILVDNKTARYHQEALSKNFVLHYRQQKMFSKLFTYALKIMEQSVDNDEYRRIFVVRFDAEISGQLPFQPFRRFILPVHLADLLNTVNEHQHNLKSSKCAEDLTVELERKIEAYRAYCTNNPNYHQQLFSNINT